MKQFFIGIDTGTQASVYMRTKSSILLNEFERTQVTNRSLFNDPVW